MKQILAFLSAGIIFSLASCNNSGKEKEETKTNDTATTAKAPEKPAFTPFNVMVIQHPVKNFDKWLPVYKGHDSVRKAYGLNEIGVARGLDNPNMVYIALKADDVQKAKQFAVLPNLKETMMKAGVTKPPVISYLNVIRDDNSTIDQKERVMVAHHVKDFDTWLKAYDGEGKATRAANGLIDRGLARGVDDPNMVYVLFAISDLAKAKARINSPELKKLMTDAGVDGPPTISFYKLVN
jgi:hypothetical protein